MRQLSPNARWRLPEHPRRSKERRRERTWTAPRCWSLWVSCFSACVYSLIFEDVFAIPITSILRFIISLLCAGTRTSPPVAKAFPSPFPDLSSDLWLDSKVELAILTKQFYLRTNIVAVTMMLIMMLMTIMMAVGEKMVIMIGSSANYHPQ